MASNSDQKCEVDELLRKAVISISRRLDKFYFERLLVCSACVLDAEYTRNITEFTSLFYALIRAMSSPDKAIVFCSQVLKRLEYPVQDEFRSYACHESDFDYQQEYPKVDCMLTVLKFLGSLMDCDFRIVQAVLSNKTRLSKDRFPTKPSAAKVMFDEGLISENDLTFVLELSEQFNRRHLFNGCLERLKRRLQNTDEVMKDGGGKSANQPNPITNSTEYRRERACLTPGAGNDELVSNQQRERLQQSQAELYKKKIYDCIETNQQKEQGIIFVVTMYGIQGFDVDRKKVEETFKRLSFAVYVETSPTAQELACLMQAASQVQYPYTYKYIAFYFSGHGMIDQSATGFIGARHGSKAMTKLGIREYIINPLLRVQKLHKLFLFDCCRLINDATILTFTGHTMDTSVHEYDDSKYVMAHSVSSGKDTTSTQMGSSWTRELCRTLVEQKKPFVHIFSEVIKKTGDTDYHTNTTDEFIIKQVNDNVYGDLLKNNLSHSKKIVSEFKTTPMRKEDAEKLEKMKLDKLHDDEKYKTVLKEIIERIKNNELSLPLIDSVCRQLELQ